MTGSAGWTREPPRGPRADRRRGALGRRRGRRPAARRARGPAAGGRRRGVPRAGGRPARRPGRALRPHPRPVHRRRGRRPARARGRGGRRDARAGSPRTAAWCRGEFRPGGAGPEWCDAEVLRMLRRRSLAALRREVEPVPPSAPSPASCPPGRASAARSRGAEGVLRAVEQLAGVASRPPRWSAWSCRPGSPTTPRRMLDELTAAGEVLWSGHGALPGGDGWVSLHLADHARRSRCRRCTADILDAAARVRGGPRGRAGAVLPGAVRRPRLARRQRR